MIYGTTKYTFLYSSCSLDLATAGNADTIALYSTKHFNTISLHISPHRTSGAVVAPTSEADTALVLILFDSRKSKDVKVEKPPMV